MGKQKDTKKTGLIYTSSRGGQNKFYNGNSTVIKPIYEFAHKKTQKLVTALYLVADCMNEKDTIREELRLLGIKLLSDIHMLSTSLPKDDNAHINLSLSRIKEIISLLQIAEDITYISSMNANLLKNEFNILTIELESRRSGEKHFSFNLTESMFEVSKEGDYPNRDVFNIKDTNKRTQSMSFIKDKNKVSTTPVLKKSLTSADYKKIKEDRSSKIVSIIKEKNKLSEEATIKDISIVFPNYSDKTIQRELNNLIEKGQIKKIGSKRWSRYSVI